MIRGRTTFRNADTAAMHPPASEEVSRLGLAGTERALYHAGAGNGPRAEIVDVSQQFQNV